MKQILLKIARVFLYFAVFLIIISLIFGMILYLGLPLWTGIFILIGLTGICGAFFVLKKIFLRRNEERFVKQIIAQDTDSMKDMGDKERKEAQEIQQRWKEAIGILKQSYLKKDGNPLYALPWYMIIGESGSGKTTAIESAELSGKFSEISRTSGPSGTKNCDWWFFEKAIIIDTAGKYAIPVDEGRDKEEWQKFLTHLVKYRKKEPLNGLIVTIEVDKLVESGNQQVLEEDGKEIRRRIKQLMEGLGAKFPIYVLVTKCDHVKGMTQFCDLFPEKGLKRAMGFLNHGLSSDINTFLKEAMQTLGEHLRDQRIHLVYKAGTGRVEPGLLLFPEEFEKLETGLDAFIKGVFYENPYEETPILRGLYFSSGRQEGIPYSHFLKSLGLIGEREVLPDTRKGLFLHDIFSKILPGDRYLYKPTEESWRLKKLTRNLGLCSWIAIIIAFCGLLSFSFAKNLHVLNFIGKSGGVPELKAELLTNVNRMDDFRISILKAEEENRHWWIPRFGLNTSIETVEKLKEKYCEQFKTYYLESLDQNIAIKANTFSNETSDSVIGNHAAFLVRRINLMKARLNDEGLNELEKMPQPAFETVMSEVVRQEIPVIKKKFQNLYLYYLLWWGDKTRFNRDMNELQALLKHIVIAKRNNLNWMAGWINEEPSLSPVLMENFWESIHTSSDDKYVPSAFTIDGKKQIDGFVGEMRTAFSEPLELDGRIAEFKNWYKISYLTLWHDFGDYFPKGKEKLKNIDDWKYMVVRMGSGDGPYFSLFERMNKELTPFADEKDMAPWITHIRNLEKFKLELLTLQESGVIPAAKRTGKRWLNRITGKAGVRVKEGEVFQVSEAAKSLKNYLDYLDEIIPIADDREDAYKMTRQVFKESQASSESPFYKADLAYEKLLKAMGDVRPDQKMFRSLLYGPLDFMWEYACNETSCHIQDSWVKNVIWALPSSKSENRCYLLFHKNDGIIPRFIESDDGCAPFISRGARRGSYESRKELGRNIPFKRLFSSFLTEGKELTEKITDRYVPPPPPEPEPEPEPEPLPEPLPAAPTQPSNYIVTIKGEPTGVNHGARKRPHLTVLELRCADKITILENRHYPVSEVFNWTPETCREVIFKIYLEDIILTKNYRGEKAFQSFIKDFKSGRRIFTPRDFPFQANQMNESNIQEIDVNYKIIGDVQGISSHKFASDIPRPKPRPKPKKVLRKKDICIPPPVPKDIVECWDS